MYNPCICTKQGLKGAHTTSHASIVIYKKTNLAGDCVSGMFTLILAYKHFGNGETGSLDGKVVNLSQIRLKH